MKKESKELLDSTNDLDELEAKLRQEQTEFKEYYQKATNQGDANAMKEVGICLLNGVGVNQSTASGFNWLEKACRAGNNDAIDLLKSFSDKWYVLEYKPSRFVSLLQEIADMGNLYATEMLNKLNTEEKDDGI